MGDIDAGLANVEDGFELYRGLSTPPVFWPTLLMLRAMALGMAGHGEKGLTFIRDAAATLQPGDPMAPDVGIVHGQLLLVLSPPDAAAADAELERTAEAAGGCGARMAQLLALTHLVELRRGTRTKPRHATALRDVYDGFTEGFDAAPLTARATLST